jgi:hypothetical protein
MPVVVERMVAGVALGALAPVTLAIAAAGDGLWLEALDFGFVLAAGGALVWGLRRQLRRRIAAAGRRSSTWCGGERLASATTPGDAGSRRPPGR